MESLRKKIESLFSQLHVAQMRQKLPPELEYKSYGAGSDYGHYSITQQVTLRGGVVIEYRHGSDVRRDVLKGPMPQLKIQIEADHLDRLSEILQETTDKVGAL